MGANNRSLHTARTLALENAALAEETIMSKIIACVVIAVLVASLAIAEEPKSTAPDGGTVSLTLDDVQLRDVVRMMTRIAGVDLSFDSKDPTFGERTSINVENKPWKPFFSSVLAQHGLLLVEDSPGSQTYSIIRAASPDAAARIRASQDAVAFVDAVLADLNADNLAAAKDRLVKYREHNAEVIKTTQERQQGIRGQAVNSN